MHRFSWVRIRITADYADDADGPERTIHRFRRLHRFEDQGSGVRGWGLGRSPNSDGADNRR